MDDEVSFGGFSYSSVDDEGHTTLLGAGQYGTVYKGTHKATNTTVAIKVLNENALRHRYYISEAELQRSVQHPNVVRCFGLEVCRSIIFRHGRFLKLSRRWPSARLKWSHWKSLWTLTDDNA